MVILFTLPEEEDGGGRKGGMSTQGNFRRRCEPPDTESHTCRETQFLSVGTKIYNYLFCQRFETPPLPKICILDIALLKVSFSCPEHLTRVRKQAVACEELVNAETLV